MKIIKKRFFSVKDKSEKLLSLLLQYDKQKKDYGDILQLTYILKFIYDTCDNFLKTKGKDRPLIDDEGVCLEHFFNLLSGKISAVLSQDKFYRVFGSLRIVLQFKYALTFST